MVRIPLFLRAALAASLLPLAAQAADLRLTHFSFFPGLQPAGHGAANVGFQNDGPGTASNVTLTVTVTGSTDITLGHAGTSGGTCVTTPGANSATIVCTYPSIGGVNDETITISAAMTGTTVPVVNASITSDTPDENPANNTLTFPLDINYADVTVTKSGPASVQSGTDVTYTITIAAPGAVQSATSQSVTLTDTLPSSLSFVSLTQTGGPTYICTTGQTISCTNGVPIAQTATFSLVAHVNATSGTIANTASGSTTTFDPDTTNNSATSTTTVTPAAVPTLSEWALFALAGALALVAAKQLRG
jgi:uncharacterized repeat protein (TIGR01451 family)